MLKDHPKGLFVAFFTNMGERFGFYTMMAILVLFLQVKFGLTEETAGDYYSWFYYSIYGLALVGGLIADWTKKYKLVIMIGQIIMFLGYLIMAIPGEGQKLWIALIGLFTIAIGNGLFKGNLQAIVGQLYDNEKYSKFRDSAYMIFYMGINIGAFFAPFVATGVRNWWLKTNGFLHDGSIPALCHQLKNGTLTDTSAFQALANKVSLAGPVTDLNAFANSYLGVFSEGYNYAFAIASIAMVISLLVYLIFNKALPNKEKIVSKDKPEKSVGGGLIPLVVGLALIGISAVVLYLINGNYQLGLAIGLFLGFSAWILLSSTKEEKKQVISLLLVFVVVIFFWMSFHQNGLTLTFFARDYTVKDVGPFTNLFFNLESILCVIATVGGLIIAFGSNKNLSKRLIGAGMTLVFGALCYYFVDSFKDMNPIAPEIFQSFNPLFIVALTPLVMGFFTTLNKKGKEPSTPKKIGFGMIIAAIGFIVVLVASLDLISPYLLGKAPTPDSSRVSPYWLMSSYLILTIAELFLSPMGLSFVSKVAPSRFQGLMQGGWLLATATGNKLLFIGSLLWGTVDLYMLWGLFAICCFLSAAFIFSILKRLENATKQA